MGFSTHDGTGATVHAFLYKDGVMRDLGALPGGGSSYATAVNASGTVVGHAAAAGGETRAFLYDGGTLRDLGTFGTEPFAFSRAADINDAGAVVGTTSVGGGSATAAFLYRDGKTVDLNALLPPGSGWRLTGALGINNRGQIVGEGVGPTGEVHGYLLTPDGAHEAPEPGTLALAGLGALGLAGYGWARRRTAGRRPRPFALPPPSRRGR